MTKNINIRFAKPEDISILVEMQIEFEEFFQQIDNEFYTIDKKKREKDIFENNFSNNALLRTLVAEEENKIIGRISFYKGYTAECPPYYNFHLSGIYIKKEYRGKHIAEKLINELVEIAKKENIEYIKWSVYGLNEPGIKLYNRIGGKRFAEDCNEHFMFLKIYHKDTTLNTL